jgi:hypothetical protein
MTVIRASRNCFRKVTRWSRFEGIPYYPKLVRSIVAGENRKSVADQTGQTTARPIRQISIAQEATGIRSPEEIDQQIDKSGLSKTLSMRGFPMQKLNAGDTFPNYHVQTVAHDRLAIPEAFKGRYAVLLFYRGGW